MLTDNFVLELHLGSIFDLHVKHDSEFGRHVREDSWANLVTDVIKDQCIGECYRDDIIDILEECSTFTECGLIINTKGWERAMGRIIFGFCR